MIKFIKKNGRVIPIRAMTGARGATEESNIHEVTRARQAIKKSSGPMDEMEAHFWRYTRARSKVTGKAIAKRIARFKIKGKL